MRRLLQLGTILLLLAAFLTPLLEFFDRWDPPGPGNDTEMAVLALIFMVCLVLLVAKLIAALQAAINFVLLAIVRPDQGSPFPEIIFFSNTTFQQISPPLQI